MPRTPQSRWRVSPTLQTHARELRHAMTPAERKLWQRLRDRQILGAYFRAQHPVDRFILDFVCIKARLVIEVDGDSHAAQSDYDAERTNWLAAQHYYQVLRFTNGDITHNLESVLEAIRLALDLRPPKAH
jgi:very-short-patch-repair endonuclease